MTPLKEIAAKLDYANRIALGIPLATVYNCAPKDIYGVFIPWTKNICYPGLSKIDLSRIQSIETLSEIQSKEPYGDSYAVCKNPSIGIRNARIMWDLKRDDLSIENEIVRHLIDDIEEIYEAYGFDYTMEWFTMILGRRAPTLIVSQVFRSKFNKELWECKTNHKNVGRVLQSHTAKLYMPYAQARANATTRTSLNTLIYGTDEEIIEILMDISQGHYDILLGLISQPLSYSEFKLITERNSPTFMPTSNYQIMILALYANLSSDIIIKMVIDNTYNDILECHLECHALSNEKILAYLLTIRPNIKFAYDYDSAVIRRSSGPYKEYLGMEPIYTNGMRCVDMSAANNYHNLIMVRIILIAPNATTGAPIHRVITFPINPEICRMGIARSFIWLNEYLCLMKNYYAIPLGTSHISEIHVPVIHIVNSSIRQLYCPLLRIGDYIFVSENVKYAEIAELSQDDSVLGAKIMSHVDSARLRRSEMIVKNMIHAHIKTILALKKTFNPDVIRMILGFVI